MQAVEPPLRAEFRLWAAAETGPTSHRGREGGCPPPHQPEAPRPGLFWVAPAELGGQAQKSVLWEGKEAVPGNWAAQTGSSLESCAKSSARLRKKLPGWEADPTLLREGLRRDPRFEQGPEKPLGSMPNLRIIGVPPQLRLAAEGTIVEMKRDDLTATSASRNGEAKQLPEVERTSQHTHPLDLLFHGKPTYRELPWMLCKQRSSGGNC